MVNEKKPSIYVDRGTIGSSDELDEYGVWVKSEPQDLSSAGGEIQEKAAGSGLGDFDLDLPETDELPDFALPEGDDSLNSGLDDFELPVMDDSADSEADPFAGETAEDESFLPGSDPETDIFASGDSDSANLSFADFTDQADMNLETGGPDSEESDEELELPDFSMDDEDTESGTNESLDLDLGPADETDSSLAEEEGFTEISMDEFIGTLDAEQESAEETSGEEIRDEKIPDAGASLSESDTGKKSEEQKTETKTAADLSTQLLVKIADELASIRTELSTLKKEFTGIKAAAPNADAEENGFFNGEDDEKIALTGDELNNILNTADFTEEAGADATIDLAELSEEKTEKLSVPDNAAEPESEDETLSIMDLDTGLDETVLNEPSLEDGETGLELSDDESTDFDISLEESIPLAEETNLDDLSIELDETNDFGDFPADENTDISLDDEGPETVSFEEENPDTIPEISLDDVFAEDGPLSDSLEDISEERLPDFAAPESEELKQLRESGAEPITFPPDPEDSEYLAEDPLVKDPISEETAEDDLSMEDLSGESIDLSDAVIDEPDLSLEIQENPLDEPSPEDISISLDMDETPFTDDNESDETEAFEEIADNDEAEEEIELPLEIPDEVDLFEEDSNLPGFSPETENADSDDEEGGDLSLIPEGFVVEADDDSQPLPESNEDEILSGVDDILAEEAGETPEEAAPAGKIEDESPKSAPQTETGVIPVQLKNELKTVLSYMDQLLESLPDDKIEEFARSEHFDTYKKLFKELGLV